MKKIRMFSIRISEKEYNELFQISKTLDISASELIRQLIQKEAKKLKNQRRKNEH